MEREVTGTKYMAANCEGSERPGGGGGGGGGGEETQLTYIPGCIPRRKDHHHCIMHNRRSYQHTNNMTKVHSQGTVLRKSKIKQCYHL
jgi:hypothetical protein